MPVLDHISIYYQTPFKTVDVDKYEQLLSVYSQEAIFHIHPASKCSWKRTEDQLRDQRWKTLTVFQLFVARGRQQGDIHEIGENAESGAR